jgi:cytochrome P450
MFGIYTDTHFLKCTADVLTRAILHDEHTYPEPLEFHPERFENQEKNRLAGINELPQAAFGFGRR